MAWLQAVTISVTTVGSIALVMVLRPGRKRRLPFYSDATHGEPERSVLSVGENVGWVLGAATQMTEHLWLRAVGRKRAAGATVRRAVRVYGWCGAAAMGAWVVTANVPTVAPVIWVHQLAASVLMVALAAQGSVKWWLAGRGRLGAALGGGGGGGWWERCARTVRAAVAAALWVAVVGCWVCYYYARRRAAAVMAALVYCATGAAVALMALTAVDVRGQWVEVRVVGAAGE